MRFDSKAAAGRLRVALALIVSMMAGPTMAQPLPVLEIDENPVRDTYEDITGAEFVDQWGPYNVHDPSILDDGEFFYSYSTDVSYGFVLSRGSVQIRRSPDLVHWEFRGWALDGLPPKAVSYTKGHGVEPLSGTWAPYALKTRGEYRIYYSQPGDAPMFASIGLLTGPTAEGPFEERGLVVTSREGLQMTNAIDPSVVVTPQGEHWMIYGSAFDGIYVLQLDPRTGLAAEPGSKGKRVAQRGSTDGMINGNIEGAEIIYHPGRDMYYLFIAYDWLATKYNVRVGRADQPQGPYKGFHERNLNEPEDNLPMILAPYKFDGHPGWQGVAHCAVFERDGQYFIAHQGRPANSAAFMILHVRKMYWTQDGWPIVSPQRYAAVPQSPVSAEELIGDWERIDLNYRVVPGFAEEQTDPDLQKSKPMRLDAQGTINGHASRRWRYDAPWLTLDAGPAGSGVRVRVDRAWDWERQRRTLIFTGLTDQGIAVWGKHVPQE